MSFEIGLSTWICMSHPMTMYKQADKYSSAYVRPSSSIFFHVRSSIQILLPHKEKKKKKLRENDHLQKNDTGFRNMCAYRKHTFP